MASEAVILVVDDDPNDLLFLKRAFHRVGVRQPVRAVRDGDEAVAYLEGAREYGDRGRYPLPCLVLLDIKLPRRNGLEVLRWLRGRQEFKDLPVCMITSSDDERDRAEAGKHGIEAYCVKPVSFEDLIQWLRRSGSKRKSTAKSRAYVRTARPTDRHHHLSRVNLQVVRSIAPALLPGWIEGRPKEAGRKEMWLRLSTKLRSVSPPKASGSAKGKSRTKQSKNTDQNAWALRDEPETAFSSALPIL